MKMMDFFRRKDNPAMRSVLAMYGSGTGPAWRTVDYKTMIDEGYKKCAVAFSCIKAIAGTASRISWTAYKRSKGGSEWDEFDTHPLLDLMARPNEYESGARFQEKVLAYLLMSGNSYIYRNSGIKSAPPEHLYSLRPDRMEVEKSGNWKEPIKGYTYSAGASPVFFERELIMHLMEFHPLDDFYGLSRIEVAARQVDIFNQSTIWNMNVLQKDMRIPGVVTAKNIQQADVTLFKAQFMEAYQGYANAGAPLVFGGEDIDYKPLAMNPKDMDWLEGQKLNMRQICAIFGVPSQLLGDTEASTYANYQEARKALYAETLLPLMDILRDEYNHWLTPLYGDGLYLDYDRDGIEALQEEREKKYAYLTAADFLTVNEKRVACGYDEVDGGDVILVPFSNLPLGAGRMEDDEPDDEPEDEEEAEDDEEEDDAQEDAEGDEDQEKRRKVRPIKAVKKSFWTAPERKERLWKAFEGRVVARQRVFASLAEKYLDRQWRDLKTKIGKLSSMGHASARSLFDVDAETAKYAKTFGVWYEDNFIRAGNAGMRASKGELFDDGEWKADKPKPTSWVFTATEEELEALHDMIFNSGTKVNKATLKVVEAAIKRANAENMTVQEFAQDIWREVADFDPWRARLWARTESAKVDNYGQVEGYKQTEFVERKGWMCSFVPDSRESHQLADGQERALDEPFDVGGDELMFPGDGSQTDAGNVANCLCATYPIIGEG